MILKLRFDAAAAKFGSRVLIYIWEGKEVARMRKELIVVRVAVVTYIDSSLDVLSIWVRCRDMGSYQRVKERLRWRSNASIKISEGTRGHGILTQLRGEKDDRSDGLIWKK